MKQLTDADRYNYQEGKIWALEHLLSAALKGMVLNQSSFNNIYSRALEGFPGARGANQYVAKGVRETFNHVGNQIGLADPSREP